MSAVLSPPNVPSRPPRGAISAPAPAAEGGPRPASFGSRYETLGPLAEGGVGVLLRGRDADLGREVVLKVLKVFWEIQVLLVLKALKVRQERLVLKVLKAFKVLLVRLVLKVLKA